MNIYLYETRASAKKLAPIALTRPLFDLRCGAFTFLERLNRLRPDDSISLFVREEQEAVTKERFGLPVNPETVEDGLWLNSTVFWTEPSLNLLESKEGIFTSDGAFIGSNTALVAPVKIGKKAVVGAGSSLTNNVKNKSLALTRAKQIEIKNYRKK